jgi:hypothetical protein
MERRLAQHLGSVDAPCEAPRLPALHRGVFLTASGRAFVTAFRFAVRSGAGSPLWARASAVT